MSADRPCGGTFKKGDPVEIKSERGNFHEGTVCGEIKKNGKVGYKVRLSDSREVYVPGDIMRLGQKKDLGLGAIGEDEECDGPVDSDEPLPTSPDVAPSAGTAGASTGDRSSWTIGTKIKVYSNSAGGWCDGNVKSITGSNVVVSYDIGGGVFNEKGPIPIDDSCLKPLGGGSTAKPSLTRAQTTSAQFGTKAEYKKRIMKILNDNGVNMTDGKMDKMLEPYDGRLHGLYIKTCEKFKVTPEPFGSIPIAGSSAAGFTISGQISDFEISKLCQDCMVKLTAEKLVTGDAGDVVGILVDNVRQLMDKKSSGRYGDDEEPDEF